MWNVLPPALPSIQKCSCYACGLCRVESGAGDPSLMAEAMLISI